MTASAVTLAPEKRATWAPRLLAVTGFVLAAGFIVLGFSQQVAAEKARTYLRTRYKANMDVPVRQIRPDFIFDPSSGKPAPPLGFCWTIEVDAGVASGEVQVNPWNHEIVDWNVDL